MTEPDLFYTDYNEYKCISVSFAGLTKFVLFLKSICTFTLAATDIFLKEGESILLNMYHGEWLQT